MPVLVRPCIHDYGCTQDANLRITAAILGGHFFEAAPRLDESGNDIATGTRPSTYARSCVRMRPLPSMKKSSKYTLIFSEAVCRRWVMYLVRRSQRLHWEGLVESGVGVRNGRVEP